MIISRAFVRFSLSVTNGGYTYIKATQIGGVQCIKETQNKKRRAETYVKVRLFHIFFDNLSMTNIKLTS